MAAAKSFALGCFALLTFAVCEAESRQSELSEVETVQAQHIQGEFRGLYERGRERSIFMPCGSDEDWWLDAKNSETWKRFYAPDHHWQYLEVIANVTPDAESRPERLKALNLPSMDEINEAQARVFMLSGYGHLGKYDREITVSDVLRASPVENPLYRLDFEVTKVGQLEFRQAMLDLACGDG